MSQSRLLNELEERVRVMAFSRVERKVSVGEDPDDEDQDVVVGEFKLDELLRRARHLVLLDEMCGTNVVDGYPSKTPLNGSPGAGKGGRPTMEIPIEDSALLPPDHVPTSSTEVAALTDVPRPDPVHRHVIQIVAHIRRLVVDLELLDASLGAVDRIRSLSKVPDPPQCYVISELLGIKQWDPTWEPAKWSTFPRLGADAFDEPKHVCMYVWHFVKNHGRLPTQREALKYLTAAAASRLAGRRSA